ncbi:MAG TPA: hypothetical protein VJ890_16940 [Vineibacter sp.]|nr:hypothetical protein [Vineibacter sp.]
MVMKVSKSRLAPGRLSEMPGIYDLSEPVGISGGRATPPNKRDDVLLVQYFLQSIFKASRVRPLGHMSIDGIYGPMTHYWSLFFMHVVEVLSDGQSNIREEAGNINPFTRNEHKFPIGGGDTSMIFQMNYQFWKLHKTTFAHLERDEPTVPGELKQVLLKSIEANRKAAG